MEKKKILIIRFSSFGDIIQAMSAIDLLKRMYPFSEIHFATKKDFESIVKLHPDVDKVICFERNKGLFSFIKKLRECDYEMVYDAHRSLRSSLIIHLFFNPSLSLFFGREGEPVVVSRSKERFKRLLLFIFGRNLFPWPFKGRVSYQAPLLKLIKSGPVIEQIGFNFPPMDPQNVYLKTCQEVDNRTITIAPSANWEMKKWPLSNWFALIEQLPEYRFIILGGPQDAYLSAFEDRYKDRVTNLAGKLSLVESCYMVSKSKLLISADTGLMHVGDYLGVPTIALIGPTAFGFPSGDNSITLSVDLKCRPCTKDGRGKCSQKVYQKCMVDITPERVKDTLIKILKGS